MKDRLQAALGANYRVDQPGSQECDYYVDLPDPIQGAVTICVHHRTWCPGISQHAHHTFAPTWGGRPLSGYKGRGWVEAMAADILAACSALVEDLIQNQPGWLGPLTPDQAREAVVFKVQGEDKGV